MVWCGIVRYGMYVYRYRECFFLASATCIDLPGRVEVHRSPFGLVRLAQCNSFWIPAVSFHCQPLQEFRRLNGLHRSCMGYICATFIQNRKFLPPGIKADVAQGWERRDGFPLVVDLGSQDPRPDHFGRRGCSPVGATPPPIHSIYMENIYLHYHLFNHSQCIYILYFPMRVTSRCVVFSPSSCRVRTLSSDERTRRRGLGEERGHRTIITRSPVTNPIQRNILLSRDWIFNNMPHDEQMKSSFVWPSCQASA